jgi:F-type H+-transporting ATPase subunit a
MKGCGCSTSLIIIVGVVLLALFGLGFVAGPIGQSLIGLHLPEWLELESPEVSLPAEGILHIGGFSVTNTLIASLLTTVTLLLLVWGGTRKLKLVPGRLQALLEIMVETLLNFSISVAGQKYGRRFFPIVATIFLYVMFNAYLGLLPIFGTIIIHEGGHALPLLRPANTDLNLTAAIAICSFIFIEYWGIRALGAKHYLSEFFNFGLLGQGFKEVFTGKMRHGFPNIFFGVINVFIGLIELLSHFIRLVSFSCRLFGNMIAGEILLLVMTFLITFVVVMPFYGLELIVGVIQALIFAGLTLVFATIAVKAGGEEEHEH